MPCWSSRPQVRNASHSLRSVTFGLVADGRDEQDVVFRIDVGSGDRHAGVEVADDELDAVADELVRDRHALLRIGDVVALLERDLLAEDAAGLVDVVDRLLRAVDELRPESGVRSGDRPGDAHLDLRAGGARERQSRGERDPGQPIFLSFSYSHEFRAPGPPGRPWQNAIPP